MSANVPTIEKAILADVCLGIPLGKIVFSVPVHLSKEDIGPIPSTFLFRGEQLALMRFLFQQGEGQIISAVSSLSEAAGEEMKKGPYSVVHKTNQIFSQDPHDYQSLAKYWWPPEPGSKKKRYTRKDGAVNPETYSDEFDYIRLVDLSNASVTLSLSAYLAGNASHGKRAAALLETWFVDPKTRQNPHFEFAQRIPGKNTPRWEGLIEARFLIYVTEAARLLESMGSLKPSSSARLKVWFADLLKWMRAEKELEKAAASDNNLGFWYDLQCLVYAHFSGDETLFREILADVAPRLSHQMSPDGALPHELGRAAPHDYVAFTLAAMALISRAGEHEGLALWDQKQGDGRNFQVAHDWLLRTGRARELLSSWDLPEEATKSGWDLGLLLDVGLKLRAVQRVAEAEAENALRARKELAEVEEKSEDARVNAESLAKQLAEEQRKSKGAQFERESLIREMEESKKRQKKLKTEKEKLSADLAWHQDRAQELEQTVSNLAKDRDALLDYGNQLEKRYRMLLSSTSWRIMGPLRLVKRRVKSLWTGRPGGPNRMPKKPVLSASSSKGPNILSSASRTPAQQPKKDPVSPDLDWQQERVSRPIVAVRPSLAESVTDKIAEAARRNLPGPLKEAVKTTLAKAPQKDPLEMLLAAQPRNEQALKKEYRDKGLDKEPDTFVLYRIIGNDLYPRHKKGQSRENVQFLLENEPPLEDCEKRWVVNRIVDPDEERVIISMLEGRGQPYLHIPFVAEEYRKIGWDFECLPEPGFLAGEEFQNLDPEQRDRVRTALYRLKNNYVMHNNGARNAALRDGRARAKWVLPFDGNGFVTQKAWHEIRQAVTARPHLKYFAVPMERITDNATLLSDDFTPHPVEEPQLLFRCDTSEEFNQDFPYGRRPKVELFWRLGIPGPWDRWRDDAWEQRRRPLSPEAHQFGVAGWVARMNSGAGSLEQKNKASFKNRGLARQEAIVSAIDHVDALVRQTPADPDGLAFYTTKSLDRLKQALREGSGNMLPLAKKIIEDAERALDEEPYSVIQKTTLAPSGDPHDYWHPAPYWWPDPKKKDGLPYIRKDGQRVPGTRMYEPDSAQYDRTRLQLMFDGTTALALGWYLTGREDFAAHGARLIRTWFLDPATRMNPHLRYSQVRLGHNNDEGAPTGIIELKDLYYVLDAVRLLEKSGAFDAGDSEGLKAWLRDYLAWLETSPQGKKEVAAANNHGTYFDLQTAAIAAYLGEKKKLRDIFLRTQSRITQQFTPEGIQPDEMKRSITQHYVFFNLQGWLNIFQLARANGLPMGDWGKEPHARVAEAFRWIVEHDMVNWPYEQIEPFDTDRLFPLAASARNVGIVSDAEMPALIGDTPLGDRKPIFDPHDAVRPYWNGVRIKPEADHSRFAFYR